MLKKKIIASSINNLTDARYFAGWMVDFFVFNIDPDNELYINPQEIGVFQSWVEGPKYFLEMNKDQLNYAEKYLVDLNCQGVIIDYTDLHQLADIDIPLILKVNIDDFKGDISSIYKMGGDIILFSEKEVSSLIDLFSSRDTSQIDIYVNIKDQSISEEDLIHSSLDGFMLHGSPEEKVGYKSYDELDEIFEVLQDF